MNILDDKFDYLFSPLIVPIRENESEEEFSKRWAKFDSLPEAFKDRLSNEKIPEIIKNIAEENNLQLSQVADISRLIRGYYFGEIKAGDFSNFLIQKLRIDSVKANAIARRIINEIINSEFPVEKSEIIERHLIDISILKAIQQYSKLGEQLVTSSPIKLKIFPQSVRPSIKNWIEDYRSTMGAQKHGMMERGNYLFHSENGKMLTSGDRKKLAEVLRSLDEDVALKVDPDRQEVIFEIDQSLATKPSVTGPIINNQNTNKGFQNSNINKSDFSKNIPDVKYQMPNPNLSFSSPHVFPNEKNDKIAAPSSNNPSASRPLEQKSINPQTVNLRAGKPWVSKEESDYVPLEPKIKGNVVDLKN